MTFMVLVSGHSWHLNCILLSVLSCVCLDQTPQALMVLYLVCIDREPQISIAEGSGL